MSSRRLSSPPPISPCHSRASSIHSGIRSPGIQQHAPVNPSGLREAHTIPGSPEDVRPFEESEGMPTSSRPSPKTVPTRPDADSASEYDTSDRRSHGQSDLGSKIATESTTLLRKTFEFVTGNPHAGPCDHGTFSPRVESRPGSLRSGGFGGSPAANGESSEVETNTRIFTNFLGLSNGTGGGKKKMSTTSYLAEQHGINTTSMYVLPAPMRSLSGYDVF
jgi:hypothetical protein